MLCNAYCFLNTTWGMYYMTLGGGVNGSTTLMYDRALYRKRKQTKLLFYVYHLAFLSLELSILKYNSAELIAFCIANFESIVNFFQIVLNTFDTFRFFKESFKMEKRFFLRIKFNACLQ